MSFYVYRRRITHLGDGDAAIHEGWCGGAWMRSRQRAEREAAAWQTIGWRTEIHVNTPAVRARVRAWQQHCKGFPGQTTNALPRGGQEPT